MLLGALSVGEKFSLGGITTLLGLGMTFLILVLLIGCVYLINLAAQKLPERIKGKLKSENKNNPAEKSDIVENTAAVEGVVKEIDPETIVAIQSAVQIYLSENGEDGKPHENINIKSVTKL